MTALQDKWRRVMRDVHEYDYYEDLFAQALHESGMHEAGVASGAYDDRQIVQAAHQFWILLPDNAAIQRWPFDLLCEVADNIFDEHLFPDAGWDGMEGEGSDVD